MLKARLFSLLFVLLIFAGCDEATSSIITNVEAEVSEHISTVITVRWTTNVDSTGYVEFGPTEDFGYSTPLEEVAGTDHEALLLGMTDDTEVFYRVVIWDGAEADASAVETITTGYLPTGLPQLVFEQAAEGSHDQYHIVPFILSGIIAIISPEGEYVWYHVDGRTGFEFFRARLSVDGKAILYNAGAVSGDEDLDSTITRVSLDGSEVSHIHIPLLAHDFIEMDDGTIAAVVMEKREFEGEEIKGNQIIEIAPDGTQTVVWSTWDCFDPAIHQNDSMGPEANGWFFSNALDYDSGEDAYYIGSLSFSSIVKVDRQTRECPVVFGGPGSDIATTTFTGGYPWLGQHQFEIHDDDVENNSILVFDNAGSSDGKSRIVEYDYDVENQTLDQSWSCSVGVSTFVLGEVTSLTGGDYIVTWSANAIITRVNEDCEVIWKVDALINTFGFHDVVPSLYRVSSS